MKALKIIGIVLLCIVLLVIIVSFFLSKTVKVERSLVIKADQAVIFDQVNTLKNWEKWSPWHKLDTMMKLTYSGPESGAGAMYEWDSKDPKVGDGKLNIVRTVSYDTIMMKMSSMKQAPARTWFALQKVEGGVNVTWGIEVKFGRNPLKRYFGLMMESMLGPYFDKGLASIKKIAESAPVYKINMVPVAETQYLGIRDTASMASMGRKMGEFYGEIMAYAGKNKLTETGPPFCIYYTWENDHFDIEACIPFDKVKPGEGRVKAGVLKACNAAEVDYFGPYEKIGPAYNAIESWITANNKKKAGMPWEQYMNDPMTEKDPAKLLTKIYWPAM